MSETITPTRVTRSSASRLKIELLNGLSSTTKTPIDKDFKSFDAKVKRQKKNLEIQFSTWNAEMKNNNIPAKYNTQVVELLTEIEIFLSKNFQQLVNYIKIYKSEKNGHRSVQINDLEGHWSLLLIQLEKFNKKFKSFEELKGRSWRQRS